jgi:DNA polymerase-3 subunit epsilon
MLDFDFEPEAAGWSKQLAVFDLETTGLDVTTSRIVTACIAVIDQNGEPTEIHEWLVNPGIDIPEAASNVHGITTEVAIERGMQPELATSQISDKLRSLNSSMPLVAFNAAYDFSLLKHEAIRYGWEPLVPKPVIDPLVIDRKLDKWRKGKRTLTALCSLFGVELSDAHNSTADAIAAGRLAQRLAAKHAELDMDVNELHELQRGWADEWSLSMQEFLKKQNRPDFRAELGWPIKD